MKDTMPAMEAKFRKMLMARSGAERVKMGCSMHETAQLLAKASLAQRYPKGFSEQFRGLLFLHFYARDFTVTERNRIVAALAKRSSARHGKKTARSRKLRQQYARSMNAAQHSKVIGVAERSLSYRSVKRKTNERSRRSSA